MDFLGIDVGKSDLHAALLQGERSSTKSVPNSPTGIKQLIAWLKNRKAEDVHVCLESTGGWSEVVASALRSCRFPGVTKANDPEGVSVSCSALNFKYLCREFLMNGNEGFIAVELAPT